MIQRARGRAAFRRLAADGRRWRRPPLWCTWCPDPDSTATSVAFATGRALGSAVVRNRLRRRLRALLVELDRERPFPPGILLVGAAHPAIELTFDQLRTELRILLAPMWPPTPSSTHPGTSGCPGCRPS